MEITPQSPELLEIIDTVREVAERNMSKKKLLLTVKEVGEIYSIKRTQCFEMIGDKLITSKKIGNKLLVSVVSLDKYMRA